MKKRIISILLAALMTVSLFSGITASAATAERAYYFSVKGGDYAHGIDKAEVTSDGKPVWNTAVSTADGQHTLFITSVAEFGSHGWKYFDVDDKAFDAKNVYVAQVLAQCTKIYTNYTSKGLTLEDGSKISVALEAPETAGFYKLSTCISVANIDVYAGKRTAEKTTVENYMNDGNHIGLSVANSKTLGANVTSLTYNDLDKLIYNDGSSDIIFGLKHDAGENSQLKGVKLTQVTGTPVFSISTTELDILEKTTDIGSEAKISVTLGDYDVLNGFVDYSVKDGTADVASVDENGNVTAIAGGTETIIASVGDYSKEFTINVEDKMKYVYGFIQKDHYNGDSSKLSYTGVTYFPEYTSETYAKGERNWKYHAMTDETLANYNAKIDDKTITDLPKALRNVVGFDTGGLKFTPAGGGEWLALKFRVPEAGIYKLSYTASADLSGVNSNAYISIMDGDETKESILGQSNGTLNSGVVLASGVDFNNSNTVAEERTVGTKAIAVNEDGGELLLILTAKSGYTSPMRMRAFTLTKISDVMQLSADSVELEEEGGTKTVTASLAENTLIGYMRPSYKIANTDVATVNAVGKITPKAAGETTLTVTIGDQTKTIPVVVKAKEVPADDPEYVEAFTPSDTKTESITTSVGTLAIAKDGSSLTVTKNANKNSDGTYSVSTDAQSGEYKFLYWVKGLENGGKKRIVSFDASFRYAPHNGANYLIAVYGTANDATSQNEYYNANGQRLENNTLPSMAGYGTAVDWVDCGDGIYVAKYDDANIGKYEITVNGATKTCTYGDEVVCTAEAEKDGKKFFGWKKTVNGKDAILVAASTTYKFLAWEDCSVEAVYKAEGANFSGAIRKIVLGELSVGNQTAVMAEFIGFENAVEKGIILGNADYAMTTSGSQFTIVNDVDATEISGYAILADGTKLIFKK